MHVFSLDNILYVALDDCIINIFAGSCRIHVGVDITCIFGLQ